MIKGESGPGRSGKRKCAPRKEHCRPESTKSDLLLTHISKEKEKVGIEEGNGPKPAIDRGQEMMCGRFLKQYELFANGDRKGRGNHDD
jgi:hypothetical protein